MLGVLSGLKPEMVWHIFEKICSIPHVSGNESGVADYLVDLAEKSGLVVRRDACNNIRIDKKGADPKQALLLQAHMDMVPAAIEGLDFDFAARGIEPKISGGNVVANGTSLGGDDGIGVAIAMAAMLDEKLADCNISALFTVDEERGLLGANEVDASWLDGQGLVNIDAGQDGEINIGCAGAIRSLYLCDTGKADISGSVVKVTIKNLPGGHSGDDINKDRPNALVLLAQILRELPGVIVSFAGGNATNAIPSVAEAMLSIAEPVEKWRATLMSVAENYRKKLKNGKEFVITVEPVPDAPASSWDPDFSKRFLATLADSPNGILANSDQYDVVESSLNIGIINMKNGQLQIHTCLRSIFDEKRDEYSAKVDQYFEQIASEISHISKYPAWPPVDCSLRQTAIEAWRELYKSELKCRVIHAGLECGIFCGKKPGIPTIAIFPAHGNLHSPSEYLSIESTAKTYQFLQAVILKMC